MFGNDVFVSLPTGYGKSLCFGLLPCVFDALRGVEKKSIVLVVCPLVALMKEHVVHFSSMGISAAYASDKDDPTVRQSIKNGEVQLVFLSPQSLNGAAGRDVGASAGRLSRPTRKYVLRACMRNDNDYIPLAQPPDPISSIIGARLARLPPPYTYNIMY